MTLNINEESSDNNMIEKQDVKTSISFPEKLIPDVELAVLKKNIKVDFEKLDSELRGMRVVLSDSPSSESLIKLYEIQAKGRGYYERAAEIFRYYLKFSSRITLLKQQAEQVFQNQYGLAYMYLQQNKPDLLKATKSGAERDTLVKSLIPLNLVQELQEWNVVETAVKINYNIIKSYQEQFRSVREDILVQLSIIKNLVLLGGLKVDPESMRAFKIIEASYTPTQTDLQEKADLQEKETNFEEGIVQL